MALVTFTGEWASIHDGLPPLNYMRREHLTSNHKEHMRYDIKTQEEIFMQIPAISSNSAPYIRKPKLSQILKRFTKLPIPISQETCTHKINHSPFPATVAEKP